jgi:hypothetical protein
MGVARQCARSSARSREGGYIYDGCATYADPRRGNPSTCHRKDVREEPLEEQFTELLGRLRFDDEVLNWVPETLKSSHEQERLDYQEARDKRRLLGFALTN